MGWLFGTAREAAKAEPKAAPSLQEASARIDSQVQDIEAKISKADHEIRALAAQGSSNPSAKQRGLQAMKRKKMYEQQRDQLIGTQFNIETLAFQQEQAQITCTAMDAMKVGAEQLKKQHHALDMGSVDRLADDLAQIHDDMQSIGEALAGTAVGMGVDEGDLDAEYAKMEEEMAAMKLAGGAPSPAASALAAPRPAASQALPGAMAVPAAVS